MPAAYESDGDGAPRWPILSAHDKQQRNVLKPLSKERALVGVRVEVHGNADFRRTWELVARTAGAKVVSRLLTGSADRLDVVVSEPFPMDAVVDKVCHALLCFKSICFLQPSLA